MTNKVYANIQLVKCSSRAGNMTVITRPIFAKRNTGIRPSRMRSALKTRNVFTRFYRTSLVVCSPGSSAVLENRGGYTRKWRHRYNNRIHILYRVHGKTKFRRKSHYLPRISMIGPWTFDRFRLFRFGIRAGYIQSELRRSRTFGLGTRRSAA